MRLPHAGSGAGRRWFTFPGSDFEAELQFVTQTDFMKASRRFQLTTESPDSAGFAKHMAERWFLDFRNVEDEDGNALDNTLANRIIILDSTEISAWMVRTMTEIARWQEEGNADSGSDS